MRKQAKVAVAAAAATASVLAGVVIAADPAVASTPSYLALARAEWVDGARTSAAAESKYWTAADRDLGRYGKRYASQRSDLEQLIAIPLTGTTTKQRTEATTLVRSLNVFFRTPGLYGVKPAESHLAAARAHWVDGAKVAAADRDAQLRDAAAQLAVYGKRYAKAHFELLELAKLPQTGLTKKQQADRITLIQSLNAFFRTPGLYGVKPAESHLAAARAHWVDSGKVAAAGRDVQLREAAAQLAYYGKRYAKSRSELLQLAKLPQTGLTKKQKAETLTLTRELNAFFSTKVA